MGTDSAILLLLAEQRQTIALLQAENEQLRSAINQMQEGAGEKVTSSKGESQ